MLSLKAKVEVNCKEAIWFKMFSVMPQVIYVERGPVLMRESDAGVKGVLGDSKHSGIVKEQT